MPQLWTALQAGVYADVAGLGDVRAAHQYRELVRRVMAAGLTAGQRNGADTCVRYLTGKREFLRYEQALAAGWPIATGVIEGACRHLIGDRLVFSSADGVAFCPLRS